MKAIYFDLGNTRIKWQHASGAGVIEYAGLEAGIRSLQVLMQDKPEVVFASVVKDQRKDQFLAAVRAVWGAQVHQCVVTARALGVECAYADVSRLGIDRWLAVVAAWQQNLGAVLVADLGTAATFDFVDAGGRHLGGYILPGLKLGLSALLAGTNNVVVDVDLLHEATPVPGKNTNEAVYHGAMAAMIANIETSLARLKRSNPDAKLLLTGGDSALVAQHLDCHYQRQDDLVMQGMKLLYEHGLTLKTPT